MQSGKVEINVKDTDAFELSGVQMIELICKEFDINPDSAVWGENEIKIVATPRDNKKVDPRIKAGQSSGFLDCSAIIIIPAGIPMKPGMTRDDLFNVKTQ